MITHQGVAQSLGVPFAERRKNVAGLLFDFIERQGGEELNRLEPLGEGLECKGVFRVPRGSNEREEGRLLALVGLLRTHATRLEIAGRPAVEDQAILERSRRFGLGEEMTVPVNVPGEPGGSCSFAVRRGAELPRERIQCAELVGVHAFAAARRLVGRPCISSPPHLSRRELQCLRLAAAGKTDGEIGLILGLSGETARQYVKRARAAYDVVTRTQLVVLGLRDDWISFDEGLDPGPLDP